jgi:NIMA (never in mitosis gene a)-related kinase 2
MTSYSHDNYVPLEVIGRGSFGIIRKVRRKTDGSVRDVGATLVFPGLWLLSQIFARKEINFKSMTEREKNSIEAEMCVLLSYVAHRQ